MKTAKSGVRNAVKVLNSKVTVKMMEKELERFEKMSDEKLKDRLFKITNPVKMEAFRQMARTFGLNGLSKLAAEKRNFFMDVR